MLDFYTVLVVFNVVQKAVKVTGVIRAPFKVGKYTSYWLNRDSCCARASICILIFFPSDHSLLYLSSCTWEFLHDCGCVRDMLEQLFVWPTEHIMTIFPLPINTRKKRHSPTLRKAMGFPCSRSFAYSCSKVSLQLKPPVGPCVRGRMGGSVSCQTPVSPSSSHEQNPKYGICVKRGGNKGNEQGWSCARRELPEGSSPAVLPKHFTLFSLSASPQSPFSEDDCRTRVWQPGFTHHCMCKTLGKTDYTLVT